MHIRTFTEGLLHGFWVVRPLQQDRMDPADQAPCCKLSSNSGGDIWENDDSWSSGTCALSWYILNISIYHILIDGWMDTAPGYDGIFVLHFTDLWHVQPQALYIEAFLQCSHPNRWRISNQPFLRLGLWHLSADLWERSKKHPLCSFSPGIWWQPQRCRDVKQQDV